MPLFEENGTHVHVHVHMHMHMHMYIVYVIKEVVEDDNYQGIDARGTNYIYKQCIG